MITHVYVYIKEGTQGYKSVCLYQESARVGTKVYVYIKGYMGATKRSENVFFESEADII